ncbi:MAG: phosphoribosyltransferase [Duodenibacillus sp.]|nr:phosphoribosyltransferase [Duodenibacillus sp.]
MAEHDWIDWEQYRDLCERLVARVAKSGWKFDTLLCLARGGTRPGDIFSRVYGKRLGVLSTSSYREAAGTVQGDLHISRFITGVDTLKGRVLLVDDLCDSGKTIARVVEHIKANFPEVTEVRVAVIWTKACSVFNPDYCVIRYPDNPWIHQPFECYDELGEDVLLHRCLEKFGPGL